MILVTGGAGYIGSHVVKQLLETTEDDVLVLDNLSTGSVGRVETLQKIRPFTFVELDLKEWDKVGALFEHYSIDVIMHFAAFIVVPESVSNPLKYYMNNTVNTTKLIDFAVQYGVKKFIFSSTAAVYGEPETPRVSEETPTNPINPYGMSKLMSENVLRDATFAHKEFKHVIFRYFNVAGAALDGTIGQSFPNATHLIKVAAQTAIGQRDAIHVFGTDYDTPDGTAVRDYIHVEDLAAAHLQALAYLDAHESDTFNVGYGHGFSVSEVLQTMKEVSRVDFAITKSPRRAGDPAQLISENTKIRNSMKWEAKYDDIALICKTALEWEKKLGSFPDGVKQ
jgi:UDP-glucose 4-epimerase